MYVVLWWYTLFSSQALFYNVLQNCICEGLIGHITAYTLFHCLMYSEFFFFFSLPYVF